jgi:hypothetical protein
MNINTQFTRNKAGFRVKRTAPKPTTEARERFLRHVESRDCGQDTPCRIWTGSVRFRVSDDWVTTPRRFLLAEAGVTFPPGVRVRAFCRTPRCVALGHIGW